MSSPTVTPNSDSLSTPLQLPQSPDAVNSQPVQAPSQPTPQQSQPSLDQTKQILSGSGDQSPEDQGQQAAVDAAGRPRTGLFARILYSALNGLKGAGEGVVMGGIPGAIQGAVSPTNAQRAWDQNKQVRAANTQVAVSRADQAMAVAYHDHLINNELSDDMKAKAFDRGMSQTAELQSWTGQSPMITEDSTAAVAGVKDQLQKQNGGVMPVVSVVHMPGTDGQNGYMAVFDLSQMSQSKAAPDYMKDYADKTGQDIDLLKQRWANGSVDQRTAMSQQALQFLHPQLDSSNPIGQALTYESMKRGYLLKHQDDPNAADNAKWFDSQSSFLRGQFADVQDAMKQQAQAQNEIKAQGAGMTAEATGEKQKNLAEANKANQETVSAASLSQPDALGFTPNLGNVGGVKNYESIQKSFKKNADDLAQTEQTFQQFGSILNDINAGKDMTGAQSVVGLLSAIGISAEPLKGKGFRVNNNVIEEHQEARGLGDTLYQKLLRVKDGDVITPQQLKDYATIAQQAREQKYVSLVNEAHNEGLNADFLLPKGNGTQIDPSTAKIFLTLTGNNKDQARTAASKKGWVF